MKNLLNFFFLTFSIVLPGYGRQIEISPTDAISVAKTFFANNKLNRALTLTSDSFEIKFENNVFYNIAYDGGGFVIVAKKSDGSNAVIGYSDRGMLDENSTQSKYLERLLASQNNMDDFQTSFYGNITPVEPLLGDIMWGQGAPYNLQCPTWKEINNKIVTDGNCPTGCVATALGQIMAYNKFPVSYNWDIVRPNYSDQLLEISEASKNEVAKLLRDIGKNINAVYGVSSTGATPENVVSKIPSTMGYSNAMTMWHATYMNPGARRTLIHQELLAGRPVYIGGKGNGDGHAFVCDGIDANGFIHINWGWNGDSNGYYHPFILAPYDSQGIGAGGSHYSNNVVYITDIRAPKDGDIKGQQIYCRSLEPLQASNNQIKVSMRLMGYSLSGSSYSVSPTTDYDFYIILSDNKGNKISKLKAQYEGEVLMFYLPDMNYGNYRIYPAYSAKGSDEWKYLFPMSDVASYLNMIIDKDSLSIINSFSANAQRAFQSSDLDIPSTLNPWGKNQMKITVGNIGRVVNNNRLAVRFTDETTAKQSYFMELANHNFSLANGQKESFSFDMTPVFFWIDDKVDFPTENANIVWDVNHNYTVDIYVGDGKDYTHIASSPGHKIISNQLNLSTISDTGIKAEYSKFDLNKDNILSDFELGKVKDMTICDTNVTEIPGISHLKSLENLNIKNAPNISAIDLSENDALYSLGLNNLSSLACLNLENKEYLHSVNLYNTSKINSVFLNNLPSLYSFSLTGGDNINIETSDLPLIENFYVFDPVSKSKIGNMPALKRMRINFTADADGIDAGKYKNLEFLFLLGSKIKHLNLSALKSLKELTIQLSELEELILPKDAHNFEEIICSENKLISLTLPNDLTNLKIFNLENNNLSELNLPKEMPNLKNLQIYGNPFEQLVLPNSMNGITSFGVSKTKLRELNLPKEMNSLVTLNISNNPYLSKLSGISYPKLFYFEAHGCSLQQIDFGNLPNINWISVGSNQIEKLEINHLTSLTSLQAGGNLISHIFLNKLINLTSLGLSSNKISELDVSSLTKLKSLWLQDNKMLYFEPPFPIEDLLIGGTMYTDLSEGIAIPEGMSESKIHIREGRIIDGKLFPDPFLNNTLRYQYCDTPDNSSMNEFTIHEINDKPRLKEDKIGIPVGETGIVTVLCPGGITPNYWDISCDEDILKYEKFEREYTPVKYEYWTYDMTSAINFYFTRVSDGDAMVKIPVIGAETLECLITSEAGVKDIYDENKSSNAIEWDKPYDVYTIDGVKISSDINNLNSGIYIIRQGAVVKKICNRK